MTAPSYGDAARELVRTLVPDDFELAPLERSELEARVRAHLEDQGRAASLRFWPQGRERDCVNYLRHECSPYDQVLRDARGQLGEQAMTGPIRAVHELVHRAVARAYPFLRAEAEEQFEQRWSACLWDLHDPLHPLQAERARLRRLQREAEEAVAETERERGELKRMQRELGEYLAGLKAGQQRR